MRRRTWQQKKLDFKRADYLYREGVGPQDTRDQAETNLERAQATVDRAAQDYDQAVEGTRKEELAVTRADLVQAEQKLQLSRINLDYTTLLAPKSGVVLVRQAELGEVVAPNTPVVTLGDLDHVWLRAYISETDLGRIRLGQPAIVSTDTYPGKTYPRAHFVHFATRPSSRPRACRPSKSGSRSCIGSRSTSTIPITN